MFNVPAVKNRDTLKVLYSSQKWLPYFLEQKPRHICDTKPCVTFLKFQNHVKYFCYYFLCNIYLTYRYHISRLRVLIKLRLLFVRGFYLCAASICARLLFVRGFYLCAASICARLLFVRGFYSCVASICARLLFVRGFNRARL